MTDDSKRNKLFERAFQAASKPQPKDIALGAVRLRHGRGQSFERFIGDAQITVAYKGPKHEPGGVSRPWYVVTIRVGRLVHKLSLGGAASWHEEHGTPTDAKAIDAIASTAVRFATSPDEDDDADVASDIDAATQGFLKDDGTYAVRRTR